MRFILSLWASPSSFRRQVAIESLKIEDTPSGL